MSLVLGQFCYVFSQAEALCPVCRGQRATLTSTETPSNFW